MHSPWLAASCAGLVLLACGRSIDDAGNVCLYPAGTVQEPYEQPESPEPVDFTADAPLRATAHIGHSGGEELRFRCTLTRDGDTIDLHTHYREPPGDPQDDLRSFSATCELPGLPAGTYTLVFADEEHTLTVPSTVPPPCLGSF